VQQPERLQLTGALERTNINRVQPCTRDQLADSYLCLHVAPGNEDIQRLPTHLAGHKRASDNGAEIHRVGDVDDNLPRKLVAILLDNPCRGGRRSYNSFQTRGAWFVTRRNVCVESQPKVVCIIREIARRHTTISKRSGPVVSLRARPQTRVIASYGCLGSPFNFSEIRSPAALICSAASAVAALTSPMICSTSPRPPACAPLWRCRGGP
jgi:hypothetical protein